jgi:hypothetical protein
MGISSIPSYFQSTSSLESFATRNDEKHRTPILLASASSITFTDSQVQELSLPLKIQANIIFFGSGFQLCIIYPDGKVGGDAYWNLEQMIEQVGCLFLAQDLISLSCNCSSSLLSSFLVASFPRPSFIGSLITRLHMAVLLKMP